MAVESDRRRHPLWIGDRGLPCPKPRFVTQLTANAHGWVLGKGEGVPGESRESIGAWWDPEVWQRARAAYMYDLRHHPDAPAGFIQLPAGTRLPSQPRKGIDKVAKQAGRALGRRAR